MPTQPIDHYAVFGNPIAHSRSPFIHARFAALTGQSLDYRAELAPLHGFAPCVRAFFDAGGMGCNITVPFKHEAAALADEASDAVRLCGAANTLIKLKNGHIRAENTDGPGLVADITQRAGCTIEGARVLLVGAGGAAAGVLGSLMAQKPSEIMVVNRNATRAAELVERHARFAAQPAPKLTNGALGVLAEAGAFDIVINATAASLAAHKGGEVNAKDAMGAVGNTAAAAASSLVPASVIAANALVYDLMYGAAARAFLAWAAAHGARTRDGLGMLVEQAAAAFALWRGVMPPSAVVLAELRAVVDAA